MDGAFIVRIKQTPKKPKPSGTCSAGLWLFSI